MSKIDIVILLLLLFGGYKGYRRGFITEVVFLIASVIGIITAFHYSSDVGLWLNEKFEIRNEFLPFVGFLFVFLIVLILVSIIGRVLKTSIDKTLLGDFDSAFGAIIGSIKWAFLISVFLWIYHFLDFEISEKWTEGSWLFPYLEALAPFTAELVGTFFPAVRELFNT